jgi:hypothetical protein
MRKRKGKHRNLDTSEWCEALLWLFTRHLRTIATSKSLGGHIKTGHTGSLQNRPTEGSRDLDVVLCRSLFGQV